MGMLVFMSTEPIEQAYVATLVSVAFMSLQVAIAPYRHREDNILKVALGLAKTRRA